MSKPFNGRGRNPSRMYALAAAQGIAQARSLDFQLPRLADLGLEGRARAVPPVVFIGLIRIAEISALIALGFLIAAICVPPADLQATWAYVTALVLTGFGTGAALQCCGLYSVPVLSAYPRYLPRVLLAWTIAVGMLVAAVFFLKVGPEFSRVWLAAWYLAGLAQLALLRGAAVAITRRGIASGLLTRRAVVFGGGELGARVLASLEADAQSGIRIAGYFDERGDERAGRIVAGYPLLGGLEDLVAYLRRGRADVVLVALPVSAEVRLMSLLAKLWVLPVDIRLAAHASRLRFSPRAYSYIGSVPFIGLMDLPIAGWGTVLKWVFDKTVSGLAILALAPLMALVAIAIKLDSRGPVLFRQKRYGFNNELIEVLKFRSMYADRCDADAKRLATRDDPRVTRVGRIIRRTSVDELPQLFNVMAGTLSLVGPRPHALQAKAADKLYPDVVDGYFARHKVKPGITGWAQINGWRGETDTREKIEKRVEHDIWYIENWSVLLDVYILARTPASLVRTANAY